MRTYHPPVTAKEYAPDRVALVPAFAALRDPFALNASHFDLYNSSPENTDGWWPQEHMALAATLLPLDAGPGRFMAAGQRDRVPSRC